MDVWFSLEPSLCPKAVCPASGSEFETIIAVSISVPVTGWPFHCKYPRLLEPREDWVSRWSTLVLEMKLRHREWN